MSNVPGSAEPGQRTRAPVRGTTVLVDGLPVHALTSRGPGRTVVCVHGVGVSSRYFTPTLEVLGAEFDVLAPDLPGFGGSGDPGFALDLPGLADALLGWIDAAGLQRVALLGNSFGCQIAVETALRRPDAIERLVLQGPTTDPAARTVLGQVGRRLVNSPAEDPRQTPLILRDYRDAGLRRLRLTFRAALADRIEDKLPALALPVLVVRGERDRLVPQAWAEQVTRLLPQGRLAVVPGAAHTLNFSMPDALAEAVGAFLREDGAA